MCSAQYTGRGPTYSISAALRHRMRFLRFIPRHCHTSCGPVDDDDEITVIVSAGECGRDEDAGWVAEDEEEKVAAVVEVAEFAGACVMRD